MIVVTTGTNEQPFDRLVRAAAGLGGTEPLLVQHGSSRVARGRGEWIAFLPFDELAERIADASVVVCHAGVGSIVLARRCGHRPIVVPRRVELGEAVDDHQLDLARRMDADGLVRLVEDADALAEAVAVPTLGGPAEPRGGQRLPGAGPLAAEIREALVGFGATPAPVAAPVIARAA
jgi:UDP-N-acetylglucosamine transferase subunit ALG13